MKFLEEATREALLPEQMQNAVDQKSCTDYSEEAIPERDPAYRLPYGTLSDTQTIEHLPAARRHALADCLRQLGISATRAALLASL